MEAPKNIKVQDEDRLAQLGYKQELRRDWSMLQNFGVSFSIIVSNKYVSLNLAIVFRSRQLEVSAYSNRPINESLKRSQVITSLERHSIWDWAQSDVMPSMP